ncbi:alpha/beta fold hydrolase [Streptomyces sp. HUAS MG91]|uniref:Alpha/beta fold hydrolase n=1 Tax=Streptomyces tabacisoli TaxID=3156398 RepID=A0AAU8J1I8_9ACTN
MWGNDHLTNGERSQGAPSTLITPARERPRAAAWRTIPSWGLVAGRDKAIPPAAERWMYSRAMFRKVVEVPTSSHVAMISHPKTTAKLIEDAARATR